MRLRRESVKRPVERERHEPPPEFANVGFQLLETLAQNKGYAITNVDSLGVIERFTFAEIMRETAQWAQLLRQKGLQPGDRVVIVAGREWGWRCALLGAIRAGGVAVPCPASLPVREIGAVAADAGASLLVALRPRPDLVELDGYVALTADDLDTIDASHALRQPPHRAEARDIALILYAWRGLDLSGTMHTHASLLAQADAGEHWLGLGADERIWATADDGSGPSIWLLLAGWRRAASIVVVDLELDSEAKLELLDRLRPVAVWFSDDEYRLLGSAEVPPWVDLRSIRRAFVDTDETEGAATFSAAFGAALVPVFTLDELGVVAGWPNGRESRADPKTAQPAPGVQLAVVGEDGTELPPGEVGDVVVRGDAPTLFTGYAGREGRSRSAEWFRFGWRGMLTTDGALRLEARAPSEVVPADASADVPVLEVAEAPPPEEPVAVQEVEDRPAEEDAAREQAEQGAPAAEAHAAEERLQAEQAAIALAAAEAEERRRAEEAERLEATRRATEEKRHAADRQREEKEAQARANQEAKQREKAEAEERRRAEEEARTQARIASEEAKQRSRDEKERERREAEAAKEQARIDAAEAKQRAKDEKERERREAEAAKEQARIASEEAKQRARDEKERERREAEAAKEQARIDAAEAKQRAKDEKEREKREAVERAEREKADAEAAKAKQKQDEVEAKQRAKDEKEREKREAVERAERDKAQAKAAKDQQKQAEVEAKQRAEEDKRRAKVREREEKETRRRAEQEAKDAARADRKPAFGRRRQEVADEPDLEPEHVPDVVARIRQYGMAGASSERPAEPPEQSDDE